MNRYSFLVLFMFSTLIGAELEEDKILKDYRLLPYELIELIGSFVGLASYIEKLEKQDTNALVVAMNSNEELQVQSWSPSCSHLARCESNNVNIYKKDKLYYVLPHPVKVSVLCWVSEGLLATGSEDRRVRMWDITLPECWASGLGHYEKVKTTFWVRSPWGPGPNRRSTIYQKRYKNKPIASVRFDSNTLTIGCTDGNMYRWDFVIKYLTELWGAERPVRQISLKKQSTLSNSSH